MARESKGQRVKTFKHYEPQPDMTSREVVGVVYFDAGSGRFTVYAPMHIANLFPQITEAQGKWHIQGKDSVRLDDRSGAMSSAVMNDILSVYEDVRRRYGEIIRDQQKSKVILVWYKSNLRWIEGHTTEYRKRERYQQDVNREISFTGNPALHLKYAVLFEANDNYYRERIDPFWKEGDGGSNISLDFAHSKRNLEGAQVIHWTQEREDFFAKMVEGIEGLITRLDVFTSDLEGNTDLAIAHSANLMLPAPVGREEEIEQYISGAVSPQEAYAVIDGQFVERDTSVPQVRTRTRRRGPA